MDLMPGRSSQPCHGQDTSVWFLRRTSSKSKSIAVRKLASCIKLVSAHCSKGLTCVSFAKCTLVWLMGRYLNEKVTSLWSLFFFPSPKNVVLLFSELPRLLSRLLFFFTLVDFTQLFNGACTVCRELIDLMTRKDTVGFLDFGLTSRV